MTSAVVLAALCLSPVERVLVMGSLADALAYAAEALEEDSRATVRPPRGES